MNPVRFINKAPLVAIRLNLSVKNARETLRGILRYANERGHWSIQLSDSETDENRLSFLEKDGFQGFIGHINSQRAFKQLSRMAIPVITVDQPPLSGAICCDNATVAQGAAKFFLDRHFTNFAYVGTVTDCNWSRIRSNAFADAVSDAGFSVISYRARRGKSETQQEEIDHLSQWLSRLPRRTALFVANDERTLQVIRACRQSNKRIPDEIAIVSCDNDEILCETSTPTLSSIQMSTEAAGYEAAYTLDTLMRGTVTDRPTIIPYSFSSLVERSSTADIRMESDPLTTKAMTFIRLNHATHFTMCDLAKELHASRRTLEMRFRAATGKSLHQMLVKVRIDASCTALRTSDRTIEDIALSCGFTSASHFDNTFRRLTGQSPKAFRQSGHASRP